MSFDKVTYTDKVTKIMAKNLNDIQDELGNLSERINGMSGVFWATYGMTTAEELGAAISAGKLVAVRYLERVYLLSHIGDLGDDRLYYFTSVAVNTVRTLLLDITGWTNMGSQTIPSASSTNPSALGTAAPGTSSYYARANHVHPMPTMSLGIDNDDGLLYFYVDGEKTGDGIIIGGSSTLHRITYNLLHVTSSNNFVTIQNGASYKSVITPDSGWGNVSVTVTMDGVVLADVYDSETGNITINNVSGDLVIEATASLLPIDLLDVTWANYAISVGQSTNSYNAWTPHDMQYDDVHDKWLILQCHANKHLKMTYTTWTLSEFDPYDPSYVVDIPIPTANSMGSLHVENGVWWIFPKYQNVCHKSTDCGQTWETISITKPSGMRMFGIYKCGDMYFSGNDSDTEITYYKSSDLINWEVASFDSSLGYSVLCETSFCEYKGRFWAFNRTNDETLGHPVILVSDDQGQTWQLFSDQLLHGYLSTVSCLPFQNYIIIADIDRANGYIYYSKFDGETIEQLNSWRIPSAQGDFHNINIATNYSDTIVMEWFTGVPFYDESGGLYYEYMACDNVMLVGSTRPLPSVRKTTFTSQANFGAWLNTNAITSVRPDSEATYDWVATTSTGVRLYKTINGVRSAVREESEVVDEIVIPFGLASTTASNWDSPYLKNGAKLVKPWHNNYTSPRTVWYSNYGQQLAIFFINGLRYEYGMKRIGDLPVLIRVDYDYNLTWKQLGSATNQNPPDGYEWQADLPFRKVFDVSRLNDKNSSIGGNTIYQNYAYFEYVPVESEEEAE